MMQKYPLRFKVGWPRGVRVKQMMTPCFAGSGDIAMSFYMVHFSVILVVSMCCLAVNFDKQVQLCHPWPYRLIL